MPGKLNTNDTTFGGGNSNFSVGSGGEDITELFDTEVTKFGPDQFYNWEQDNIPIVELESRTNALYSQLNGQGAANSTYSPGVGGRAAVGGPASISNNIAGGVTLVLSSVADKANGIYTDLDELVSNIPKTIKSPTLVEICRYGNLGILSLSNFKTEGAGSLEIINRNFGTCHGGFSSINTVSAVRSVSDFAVRYGDTSQTLVTSVSSVEMFNDVSSAASTKTGVNCYNVSGWNSNYRCFAAQDNATNNRVGPINFSYGGLNGVGGVFPFTRAGADTGNYGFTLSAYSAKFDHSISSLDAKPGTENGYGLQLKSNLVTYPTVGVSANSSSYGSYFTMVEVNNCAGPAIRLSNIMVDSYSGSGVTLKHRATAGFNVNNSRISLKGTASVRNRYYGYRISNSTVNVLDGMIAYRNYPITAGVRNVSSTELEGNIPLVCSGVGLYAANSTVAFDSVYKPNNQAINSGTGTYYTIPGKKLYHFSHNGTGIYVKDSTVVGGVGGHTFKSTGNDGYMGGDAQDFETTKLAATLNTQHGIVAENSNFLYNGIPWAYRNGENGFVAKSSNIGFIGTICELNSRDGLHLENSDCTYGYGWEHYKNAVNDTHKIGQGSRNSQVHCDGNGYHNIYVGKSSCMKPQFGRAMAAYYGAIGGSESGRSMGCSSGSYGYAKDYNPMVSVDNGSKATFLSLGGAAATRPTGTQFAPVKGYVAAATNNSEITFIGTSANATMAYRNYPFLSSGNLPYTWCRSAFYAGNNSTTRFSGPTKISGFGIASLAEKNSTTKFCPIYGDDSEYFDNYGFDLSTTTGNHTKVELHALRACLVANDNSTIDMTDLGGSSTGMNTANSVDVFGVDSNYWKCISGGYMQFYPNAFTASVMKGYGSYNGGGKSGGLDYNSKINPGAVKFNRSTVSLGNQNDISTGGMCVRAVGNSSVKVDSVNFPMGRSTSAVSGVYYNLEGSGQEHVTGYAGIGGTPYNPGLNQRYGGSQLFLWNLADTSRIKAQNLLVSSVTPSAIGGRVTTLEGGAPVSGYHGPAGNWWNGVELDYYGANGIASSGARNLTRLAYNNNGPFRLVMGTRGDVKSYFDLSGNAPTVRAAGLGSLSSTGGSPIDQIIGQGYMAPVSGVSAISTITSPDSYYMTYDPSGYGHKVFGGLDGGIQSRSLGVDPVVAVPVRDSDWQGYMRNFFDQSAADTFANVRHAANDKVGFASIYNSSTQSENAEGIGEGRDGDNVTFGKGVRSLNLFDLDDLV